MTTFDDREQAFEAKYALDQEQEFKAIARRNKMLGLWAAEKMGLSTESAEQYAAAVVRADFEQPGEEDVFRKVAGDFKASGMTVSEGELRSKMDELASIAREQIRAGYSGAPPPHDRRAPPGDGCAPSSICLPPGKRG
jgi:hypothetical protein